jgi:hypothetical protein
MSLWGSKDLVGQAGTITINLSTEAVTGSGTTFNTSGFVVTEGDVIIVGAGATYGQAVISSVSSNTAASIASTQFLIPNPATGLIPAGTTYVVTQKPISTIEDQNYVAPTVKSNRTSSVFGVNATEQNVANAAAGDARKFAPPHTGWVGVTTYNDMHGTLRVKTETLVAGGISDPDANDNVQYPNA